MSEQSVQSEALKPKEKAERYLKGKTAYRYMRYVVFFLTTVFVIALPFITIDGNHIFLLSFDKKQLHLAGVAFDMQELYLMPFLLIIMFLGIFFITTLAGRVWCGWGCPQTIFRVFYRDFIETFLLGLRKNIKDKQKEPDYSLFSNKIKKAISSLIWVVLALLASANFMWFFVPPEDFFNYIQNPAEHTPLMIFWLGFAAFLVYDVIFLQENFCIYICPYARIQSVLYDNDTVMTVYDDTRGGVIYDDKGSKLWKKPPEGEGECTGCESCVKVCPTHIDIRRGMQLECINCLECSDACEKVMAAFEKPSLISWTSPQAIATKGKTRFVRFRTVAYSVVLAIVFAGLIYMGGKKEYMLLNINRASELYSVKENNLVENSYVFLFQNTDSKEHKYYFDIDNPKIKIKRPEEPLLLKAGQKRKEVVVLYTDEVLVEDARKDTPLPINITAYALDEKERIIVFRKSVFVYPRYDLLKGKGE